MWRLDHVLLWDYIGAGPTIVTGPELKRLADRGVREIDSKGGFTGPAVKVARVRGIKLFSQRKNVS